MREKRVFLTDSPVFGVYGFFIFKSKSVIHNQAKYCQFLHAKETAF